MEAKKGRNNLNYEQLHAKPNSENELLIINVDIYVVWIALFVIPEGNFSSWNLASKYHQCNLGDLFFGLTRILKSEYDHLTSETSV